MTTSSSVGSHKMSHSSSPQITAIPHKPMVLKRRRRLRSSPGLASSRSRAELRRAAQCRHPSIDVSTTRLGREGEYVNPLLALSS